MTPIASPAVEMVSVAFVRVNGKMTALTTATTVFAHHVMGLDLRKVIASVRAAAR